jgi:hypothetical protein
VAAAALLFCLRIQGADPSNLRGELPLRIEDALIAQTTGFRVLTSSRYDRTDEDRWRVNPQLEVSMPRHWQIGISSRLTDDEDRAGSRLVRLSVAHQFVVERNWIPNIAFSFAADVPRDDKSKGIDTRLKTLVTKTLTHSPNKDRLHLNFAWVHNAAPLQNERNDYHRFAAGYSRNLRPQTVLVTDYSLEQRRSLGSVIHIAEIGLRQRLGKNTVFSVGVGAGATEATSDLRGSLGLEYSF